MTLTQLEGLIKDIPVEQMATFLTNGVALQGQASLRAKARRIREEAREAQQAAETQAQELETQAAELDQVVNK